MLLFLPVYANAQVNGGGEYWIIEVEKVKLGVFTKEISKITNKNFIVDNSITDLPINILIRSGVTSEELINYYVELMRLHGIRVLQDGNLYKVVKDVGGLAVYPMRFANAESVANMINSLSIGDVRAVADIATNAVVVRSDISADISNLIGQLDTKRDQVLIQAVILEVSASDAEQLGVQWILGNKQSYGFVNTNSKTSLSSLMSNNLSLGVLGGLLGINKQSDNKFYGAILQALEQTTSANLLSSPSVLALDNEPANILIGQNVPVITGTQLDKNNEPFQTISRLDVGITLKVTPQISEDGKIKLKVYQEVSNVVNATNPNGIITNKSVIDTTILADDGQTIVLGGLIRDESVNDRQAVPKLSKIPFLGAAFRSKNNTQKKSNLIIFLQPTVIKDILPKPIIRDYANNSIVRLVLNDEGELVRIYE